MPIEKGYRQLLDEANGCARTLTPEEAQTRLGNETVLFVDLRDQAERDREGCIPGAFHAPRGTIEFWIDPTSPSFHREFEGRAELVLFCAGGMRSALTTSTLHGMGMTTNELCQIAGGFDAWKRAGLPVTSS